MTRVRGKTNRILRQSARSVHSGVRPSGMPSSEKLPIIKLLASPRPAFDASPRSFAFAGAPPGDPKGPERSDATFGGRSIAATRVTPRGSTPILPSVSPDPPGSSKSGTRERFVGMAPPRGGRAAKKPAPDPEPDDGGDTNCERCGLGDDEPNLVLCDCLLYTSPSPRDVEESRMPSSA